MQTKAFYTKQEQEDILNYIAATSESYERYIDFCNKRFPEKPERWTEAYFKRWCQRRRGLLQEARSRHRVEVQRISLMDRGTRVSYLESGIQRIEDKITEYGPEIRPSDLARLLDEQRKLLEAIARERNEWGTPESIKPEHAPSYRIRDAALKQLFSSKEPEVIDGEKSVVISERDV